MSRTKDFATDLSALSTNVDKDVVRFVKLLRNDRRHSENLEGVVKIEPSLPPDVVVGEALTSEPVSAAPNHQRSRAPNRQQQKPRPDEPIILHKVTIQLPRETVELLEEATLRQKLKKVKPDTRKDIHDEALRDWYRKHGYSA